jgi:hypothetical protein
LTIMTGDDGLAPVSQAGATSTAVGGAIDRVPGDQQRLADIGNAAVIAITGNLLTAVAGRREK